MVVNGFMVYEYLAEDSFLPRCGFRGIVLPVMQKSCSMHPYLNIRNSENDLVGGKTGLNGAGDAGKVSLSAQAGRTVQRYLEAK